MDIKNCSLPELLSEFELKASSPADNAVAWKKKTGGKVIGIAGLDIPEPLIHAAGMLPIILLETEEDITLANAYVEMHQCGYIRSLVDQAMKGSLAYCDEILFHDCCHVIRMIGDAMHTFGEGIQKARFVYFSPLIEYPTAQAYTTREMEKLRTRLEEMSGNQITEDRLATSIKVFNTQRKLLIELYDIRRKHPGILSGTEISNIVAAGMCMLKEDHIILLQRLLELVDTKEHAPVSSKIPVVVHGSLCERCGRNIFEGIEAAGGVIVDDDLYVGSRYFNTLYDDSVAPINALLKAYVNRVSPCPTRYQKRNPGDYLAGMLKNAGARGIIMVVVKFCEAHDFLYFTSHRRFEELGVSELLIETDHEGKSEGQLKTRLQGFFERLRAE